MSHSEDPDHHFAPPSPPSEVDYRHARWPGSHHRKLSHTPARPLQAGVAAGDGSPDVMIVGVCSAGKSTLLRRLRDKGYAARICAQEHSGIPYLWKLSDPEVVIYLDASLPTIRRRRRAKWHPSMLEDQHRRLADARRHCDLYIYTDGLAPEDVTSRVITFLNNRRVREEA